MISVPGRQIGGPGIFRIGDRPRAGAATGGRTQANGRQTGGRKAQGEGSGNRTGGFVRTGFPAIRSATARAREPAADESIAAGWSRALRAPHEAGPDPTVSEGRISCGIPGSAWCAVRQARAGRWTSARRRTPRRSTCTASRLHRD
ncbi:hypothetical protein SI859A1_00948 [Aurantimonas manganoxydans SI85-9A1]|uniref:Uncharacterized protein n=1 Tax=Aurantimonas manganoxydans (strain ATCC BAA-1229 / DSM 21871 / SI85-9A1) TaxID=287752 RepID=Q1YJQ0_AURMS|nr:hypothetical protein SI859A1_00948 [Aurantimonas manganoxydans SI85-9A1]